MITHHFDSQSHQKCHFLNLQLLHASIVGRQQMKQSNHCDIHSHIFTELVYVLRGSGWLEVEGQRVALHPGQTLILNPQAAHRALRWEQGDFTVLMLGMCCSCNVGWQSNHYCLISGGENSGLDTCMQLFFSELQNQPENFESACLHLAQLIVLHLNRLYPAPRAVSFRRKSALECSRVRQYIDAHFAEPLTLDQLAEYAGLNKYYLVHMFNREMGCSPISYLIERRISESKRFLSTTSIPVQQISSDLGFSSPSYFSQSFRRSTGYSPVAFRRHILCINGSESPE